jgi:hypothetical protein
MRSDIATLPRIFRVAGLAASLLSAGAAYAQAPAPAAKAATVAVATDSQAQADAILMRMADFLATTQSFSVSVNGNYDAVQASGQKIEFGEARKVTLSPR